MTRGEVSALMDNDLQVKAAELAGWVLDGSSELGAANWESHPWINPRGTRCRTIPDYLDNMQMAWMLARDLPQLVITKLIGRWRVAWFNGISGSAIANESITKAITQAFIMENDRGS